jgi:hypothetical protein
MFWPFASMVGMGGVCHPIESFVANDVAGWCC